MIIILVFVQDLLVISRTKKMLLCRWNISPGFCFRNCGPFALKFWRDIEEMFYKYWRAQWVKLSEWTFSHIQMFFINSKRSLQSFHKIWEKCFIVTGRWTINNMNIVMTITRIHSFKHQGYASVYSFIFSVYYDYNFLCLSLPTQGLWKPGFYPRTSFSSYLSMYRHGTGISQILSNL